MSKCLFCGETKKQKYDEYTSYYECDCIDAQRDRQIDDEISKLNRSRPSEKYKYEKQTVLVKINNK